MRKRQLTLTIVAAFVLALMPFVAQPPTATATTLVPTRFVGINGTDVANDCTVATSPCATIQHAHDQANPGEMIKVKQGTHVQSGIVISKDIAIVGAGRNQTIIDAGGAGRHFTINAGLKVAFFRLTLQNGDAGAGNGGAILSYARHLAIGSSRLQDNNAFAGGAISYESEGSLTIENTQLLENSSSGPGGAIQCLNCKYISISASKFYINSASGDGGALYLLELDPIITETTLITDTVFETNYGYSGGAIANFRRDMTINTSSFIDNAAYSGDGGGILHDRGVLTITGSTLAWNGATGDGGGVDLVAGELGVLDSTFSENEALIGGGVSLEGGTTEISNSTFYGNSATLAGSGGAVSGGGTAAWTLTNSILTASVNGDCNAPVTAPAGSNNLIDDLTCGNGAGFTLGPITNLDPVLGSNGGPTKTHALQANSNAIDSGVNSCAGLAGGMHLIDQRGVARPQDGDGNGLAVCDIGAYEYP